MYPFFHSSNIPCKKRNRNAAPLLEQGIAALLRRDSAGKVKPAMGLYFYAIFCLYQGKIA
jgi:hypothetical protein